MAVNGRTSDGDLRLKGPNDLFDWNGLHILKVAGTRLLKERFHAIDFATTPIAGLLHWDGREISCALPRGTRRTQGKPDIRDSVSLGDGHLMEALWAYLPKTPVIRVIGPDQQVSDIELPSLQYEDFRPGFASAIQFIGGIVSIHCDHQSPATYVARYLGNGRFSNWQAFKGRGSHNRNGVWILSNGQIETTTVASQEKAICLDFPANPTADEIIDLYLRNQEVRSNAIANLLQKAALNLKSKE